MKYHHDKGKAPSRVAEPVQVYLQPPDLARLQRLTERLSTTKSDVLRRGLEALDGQTTARIDLSSPARPMLPTFMGQGLRPGVDLDDTAGLLELMAEEDTPATR